MIDEQTKSANRIGFRRALVTGATGFIGRFLVGRLLAEGCQVNALVREHSRFEKILGGLNPDAIRVIQGDLANTAALKEAVDGVEVVFHAAGKVHSVPQCQHDEAEFYRINVTGTENLLRSCQRQQLRAFVFFSTIGVHGRATGHRLQERTPCHPEGPYASSKYLAELSVLESFRQGPMRPTILRLCLVYGEGGRGNFWRMLCGIDAERFLYVGSGENRKSLIYVEDAVEAAILAVRDSAAQGEIFVVADPSAYSVRLIAETLARHLGVTPPRHHVPASLALGFSSVLEFLGNGFGFRSPLTRSAVQALSTETVCDISKIRATLGFEARIGLEEGIARTVRWYRQQSAHL